MIKALGMSFFVMIWVTFCLAAFFWHGFRCNEDKDENKNINKNKDYERKTISRPRAH